MKIGDFEKTKVQFERIKTDGISEDCMRESVETAIEMFIESEGDENRLAMIDELEKYDVVHVMTEVWFIPKKGYDMDEWPLYYSVVVGELRTIDPWTMIGIPDVIERLRKNDYFR